MLVNQTVYSPYKSHRFFAAICICICIFLLVVSGIALSQKNVAVFVLLFSVACLAGYLAKVMYDSTRIKIIFEDDDLQIVNDKFAVFSRFILTEFPYRYRSTSYKGHTFFVLSQKQLCERRIKELANHCANTTQMYINDSIVIHVDPLQDKSLIEFLVFKCPD